MDGLLRGLGCVVCALAFGWVFYFQGFWRQISCVTRARVMAGALFSATVFSVAAYWLDLLYPDPVAGVMVITIVTLFLFWIPLQIVDVIGE